MAIVRRQLRTWAAAWLMLQAVSLGFLAPGKCCALHARSEQAPACHEDTLASQCPMRAADGTPCPMHRSQPTDDHGRCAMRGGCQRAEGALAIWLTQHVVLTDAPGLLLSPLSGATAASPALEPHGFLAPPDTPPPRA